MTEISPVSNTAIPLQNTVTSAENIGGEFNTFIKLLTAQVRNQDPLSPLDSTHTIANTMGALHALIANEWLGETITVESSWVPYGGEEIRFQMDTDEGVDRSELRVLDSSGNLIWQDVLDDENATHTWNGQTLNGEMLEDDKLFQFHIDQFRGGEYVGTIAPRIVTEVTDVATENGKLRLGTSSYLNPVIDDVRKFKP
jgi:flagellar basal-body rod modification protein FlgD